MAISDREREKVRSSSSNKKEKKREKKERKKHKEKEKEKSKSPHHTPDGLVKHKQVAKLYEADKYRALPESEPLEKSSVTEEHGQPIDLQKASCSSDSTGNNSKRKRTSTPPSSIQSHGNGNILRIRLSSQKTDDQPSTSGCNGQGTSVPLHRREEHNRTPFHNLQPCSGILKEEPSPKRNDVKLTLNNKKLNLATSIRCDTVHPVPRQEQKLIRLSEKIAPVPALAPAPAPVLVPAPGPALITAPAPVTALVVVAAPAFAHKEEKLSSHEKKILKMELKYKNLFESWVLPTIPHELVMDDDNDDDWLFGKSDEKAAKRLKPSESDINGDSLLPCTSAALQPRASYLSGVDMYAMPFTIPF